MFLGTDPKDQFWSPFAYCGGDPINAIDPDGNFIAEAADIMVQDGLQLAYHGSMFAFDEAMIIGTSEIAAQAVTQVATQTFANTLGSLAIGALNLGVNAAIQTLTKTAPVIEDLSNAALAMEGYPLPMAQLGGGVAGRVLGKVGEGMKAAEEALPALKTAVPKALRGYRYVSEGEASVIRRTGKIPLTDRLGNPKNLFYTNQEFRSGAQAQKALSLEMKPAYRIEFDLQNARAGYGGLAEPLYGQPGGGAEFILGESNELFATGIYPLK